MRTRNTILVGVVGALGLLAACGDDPPTAPTAPTRPTPAATPQELSVHAPPWFADRRELDVGQEVQLSANIRMSDGTTREGVDAEWMSSNTVVATITGSGSLVGRQPGGFEVRAEAEGLSARLSGLRVVPPGEPDFTIRNVRRYPVRDRAAHWIEFDVHAHVAISRLELGIRIYASDLFVDCDQRLYDFDPGQLQEETVMPIVCGLDVQWTHFTIAPRDGLRCEGCGRYSLEDVPLMEGGIDQLGTRLFEGAPELGRNPLGDAGFDPPFGVDQRGGARAARPASWSAGSSACAPARIGRAPTRFVLEHTPVSGALLLNLRGLDQQGRATGSRLPRSSA